MTKNFKFTASLTTLGDVLREVEVWVDNNAEVTNADFILTVSHSNDKYAAKIETKE